jgi:tritrans,polycis-undecaprenyl-diphosphate synthase [geranylgeranyl-diphosphate specific]
MKEKFIISSLLYKLYEKKLYKEISKGPFPNHIAIIPDGNRRWALTQGLEKLEGHQYGYEKMKEVLNWILELPIRKISIFAMSYENCLYREDKEKESLFKLISKALEELANSDSIERNKVRVKVIGRISVAPLYLRKSKELVEEKTKNYNDRILTIALCYGGRQEIIDAIKKIIEDVKSKGVLTDQINEESFTNYLYDKEVDDIDLVIRTSGEMRISNFLLWQCAYSELYFCDAYWPSFRKIDFWRAIRSYQTRERRMGR